MATTAKKTTAQKATSSTDDKPKRKVLTAEERIEKARAELAALEAKAGERNVKALVQLYDRKHKLVAKRDAIDEQVKEIDSTISELEGKSDKDQVSAAKEQHEALVEQAEANEAQAQALHDAAHDASVFVQNSDKG